jgi:hypothetical protein
MANRAQDYGTITIKVVRVDEENFTVYYKMLHDPKKRIFRFVPFDRQSLEVCADLWDGKGYVIEQHLSKSGTMWLSAILAESDSSFKKADHDKYQKHEEVIQEEFNKSICNLFGM